MAAQRRIVRPGVAATALGLISVLALAGCAEDSGGASTGAGEGLEIGATKEEYREAFADIDPITLNTQSPGPKGSATGKPIEDWVAAVEDWSDGKITFEIAFSNAVAEPIEIDDALNDGRLDVASTLPIYEPSEYPANAALIETGFISDQTVVAGALQSNAWPNEVAFSNDEVMAEFEDHGLVPLVPIFNSGAQMLLCSQPRTSLADIKGSAISSSGTAQSAQIKALGGSPATVAYTEVFESVERGVVDCANATLTVGVLGGFIPAAPHATVNPEVGFALAPGGWSFSKDTWDSLPLVAQQLMWDKLDVYIASNIKDKIWPNTAEAARLVRENGGSFQDFAPDAAAALGKANSALLDAVRSGDGVEDADALVDAAEDAAARWFDEIEALDVPAEVGYQDFDENFKADDLDMTAYTKLVMDKIWSERRPS
ncbi:TRAP transporter substrate-binding protein DctP [Nocardioides campestrisoli]|uniref:TRAP transporter substrate-binding protein DctP n=1 Tax=Nocardioides campestrisoli TaxID=2736757 RepID=UPI0015E71ECC|nr:TRAP transporter substrate-binding protein DctP [Nocardioides campestrisoli]